MFYIFYILFVVLFLLSGPMFLGMYWAAHIVEEDRVFLKNAYNFLKYMSISSGLLVLGFLLTRTLY